MQTKVIREFIPSDMDRVLEIWLAASTGAHSFVEKDFWESKLDAMRTEYIPASSTYVCLVDETIAGFVSLHGDTLMALFVAPEYQGQGVGEKLLNHAKALRGNLKLSVYKMNSRAVEFYLRHGFEVTGEHPCEFTTEPEFVMEFEAQG